MFSDSVKLFSISGFEIKIDPSWLLIASLITWSLSQHYFPSVLPGHSTQTYVFVALTATLLFFASLILHELAHSLVARKMGVPVERITLFMFGGVAEMKAEPTSAKAEFWIALAGPVMSFVLAFGFWTLGKIIGLAVADSAVGEVVTYLAMINLMLAIFNLLPAFPLDGGRVLRAYLWNRGGDILKATETASKAGAVLAYALMFLGLVFLFQGAIVVGLWQILLGGFVLVAARSGYQQQLARSVFEGLVVGTLMNRSPVVASPDMRLSDFVNQILLHDRVNFVPVIENGVLLGHMDQALLAGIDRENWISTRVGDVFEGLDPATTVSPDTPVQDLLARIAETGQRKFLVTGDNRLLGVVTLADLTGYLQLRTLPHDSGRSAGGRRGHPPRR